MRALPGAGLVALSAFFGTAAAGVSMAGVAWTGTAVSRDGIVELVVAEERLMPPYKPLLRAGVAIVVVRC